MSKKTVLTLDVLLNSNADVIGAIKNADFIDSEGKKVVFANNDLLAEPGFYFLVDSKEQAVARFYVGRQRSKIGFRAVLSHIRTKRSTLLAPLANDNKTYDVLFIPIGKMKLLTTAYGKGSLKTFFTREHSDDFQNIEELNRMLNDHFEFALQKY
ncbi:Ndd-like nucleoid disruption protein [Pseudomonas phage PspYZU05]|uniref:Nucleoid disruption protein n=1 Tax=Pseudomonas phage PspYZU05 TaxID=1983556 RepID=A0A2U7NJH9_9CAUD|nr:Ndd-like nucleoid disruption protein [Pseudomonas phage PspYZU05]ASD52044.1 nucleoid disruption protein [Pseudomonas phage PspYZU05]